MFDDDDTIEASSSTPTDAKMTEEEDATEEISGEHADQDEDNDTDYDDED